MTGHRFPGIPDKRRGCALACTAPVILTFYTRNTFSFLFISAAIAFKTADCLEIPFTTSFTKEIDAKAFSLAVGKVSEPIKTDVGFHIIKIKEKRAEKTVTFEDISRDLAQYLAQQRLQEAMANYISDLYEKADVKITKTFESDALLEQALKEKEAQNEKEEKKEDSKK